MTLPLEEIFGGILIVLVCLVPIKELKKEYFPLITSALSIIILSVAFKRGYPLFGYIRDLSTDESELYFSIIFKCFGIATLTGLIADMCSDFGVGSVSAKVSFIGKISVLMTCIPLVEKLLCIVGELV